MRTEVGSTWVPPADCHEADCVGFEVRWENDCRQMERIYVREERWRDLREERGSSFRWNWWWWWWDEPKLFTWKNFGYCSMTTLTRLTVSRTKIILNECHVNVNKGSLEKRISLHFIKTKLCNQSIDQSKVDFRIKNYYKICTAKK